MSFLLPLGLGLLGLIVLPLVAHSLRKGAKVEVVLPTARFTPARPTSTKERSFLEDRALLVLRVLLIALLALLAASPFARCSALALSRPSGGSLAVALVIDDSASMLVQVGGKSRFERAVLAGLDLLTTSREGDSFVVVLAGAPARTLVPRTTRVDDVREALRNLKPSERETDLNGALALAEASLRSSPQPEKQIAVLSDGANREHLRPTTETASVTFPVPELSQRFENCAIIRARLEDSQVSIETECTSAAALEGRRVRLLRYTGESSSSAREVESADLSEDGVTRVRLSDSAAKLSNSLDESNVHWVAELSTSDRDELSEDDRLEVSARSDSRAIAVFADRSSAGVETSDKTIIELALESLELEEPIRPLSSLPEKVDELRDVAVLVVDNPPGFRPETQNALEAFVSGGGVLLTFLGPASELAPLSAGFWPITEGSPHYRNAPREGSRVAPPLDPTQADLGRGYDSLQVRRRVLLEPASSTQTLLSFQDGSPLLLERPLGLGVVFTTTLPASVEESDFALRPGFLAILDRAIHASRGPSSLGASLPGSPWSLPENVRVLFDGRELATGSLSPGQRSFIPERAGRYVLRSPTLDRTRFVTRHPGEHVREPERPDEQKGSASATEALERTPISREIALLLLGLSGLELYLRRSRGRSRLGPAIEAP